MSISDYILAVDETILSEFTILVNGSFKIGKEMERIAATAGVSSSNEFITEEILLLSVSFRNNFSQFVENINEKYCFLQDELSEEMKLAVEGLSDLVDLLEKSWQLCEIFHLNPTKNISIEMAKWLKYSSVQFPFEVFFQNLTALKEPELYTPERHASFFPNDETSPLIGNMTYWDAIYMLVLRGDGFVACEAIKLHSDIADALLHSAGQISSKKSIDVNQCTTLFELLTSHPYAELINLSDAYNLKASTSCLSVDFHAWKNRVKQFRKSKLPLLLAIPELDMILRILMGELSAFEEVSDKNWMTYCLGLLLYVYPPPLTRINLNQIINTALQSNMFRDQSVTDDTYVIQQMMQEVMLGNIGPLLQSLYQYSRSPYIPTHMTVVPHSSSSPSSFLSAQKSNSKMLSLNSYTLHAIMSILPLLCTCHLTQFLIVGAEKKELMDRSSFEISFYEEILLEFCVKLNGMKFPVSIISDYLLQCPQRGSEYARELFSRRYDLSLTDKDAILLADLLLSHKQFNAAASIRLARGMSWLRKDVCYSHLLALRAASDVISANSRLTSKDSISKLLYSDAYKKLDAIRRRGDYSNLPKAVYFFQLAGAEGFIRIIGILDRTLWQCVSSVCTCGEYFSGLFICPPPPMRALTAQDREALHAVSNDYPNDLEGNSYAFYDSTRDHTSSDATNRLAHQLSGKEGVDILLDSLLLAEAILETIDMDYLSFTNEEEANDFRWLRMCYSHLERYVRIIQLRLKVNDDNVSEVLQTAVQLAIRLVTSEEGKIPARYWLHILELITWCHRCLMLNSGNESSTENTSEMQVEDKKQTLVCSMGYISKEEAYGLIQAVELVCGSYNNVRLCAGATWEDIYDLRRNLLDLWSARLEEESRQVGVFLREHQRVKELEALNEARQRRALMHPQYLYRFSAPSKNADFLLDSDGYSAYDYLSGAATSIL